MTLLPRQPLLRKSHLLLAVLGLWGSVAHGAGTYTVQAGDTLSRISREQQLDITALQRLNPQLQNPHNLKIGQVLKLPDRTVKKTVSSKAVVIRTSFDPGGRRVWPTQGRMVSGFGYRTMVVAGSNFHPAIDIMGVVGSPIVAAKSGVVKVSKGDTGYGYTVVIDHGNGWETRYSHNSKLLVSVGTVVEQGQAVAKMGSTGFSTVSHLDFRIYFQGKELNPMTLLPATQP